MGQNDMVDMPWQCTASLAALERRSQVLWDLRSFFHSRGMQEVQTPLLSRDMVVDRHLDPIVVHGTSIDIIGLRDCDFYLQTSAEFAMKRLLAAGLENIYQISSVFRAGERGQLHNPEFTMVEWYRVGEGLKLAVEFLSDLVSSVLKLPASRVETYQVAFQRLTSCDPLDCETADLAHVAQECGLNVDAEWSQDRDDWLDLIFSEVVQPRLGTSQPTIVTNYPATQSALARISAADPRTAERFELFVDGIELANGYHELLDASEFAERNQRVALQRQADGKRALPLPKRLESAMRSGLPACSGCALGLDRLLMAAIGSEAIDEVLPFPIEIA